MKRRERTRQLIELGGLLVKADVVTLTDDDRAVIFGLLLDAAAVLRSERREQVLILWRRRGKRGFVETSARQQAATSDVALGSVYAPAAPKLARNQ